MVGPRWRKGSGRSMLTSPLSMHRLCTALIIAVVVSSCGPIRLDARTVTVRAGWKETSAMLARPDYRPTVQIRLKSNRKMKGAVSETTVAGLRIQRKGAETFVERTEIRSVKLVPRKAGGHRNRALALAGGVPAGLGAGLGAWHIGCAVVGGCEEPPNPLGAAGFYAVLVAIPVMLYRVATRADRGALLITLDESVANTSPPHPARSPQGQ